MLSHPACHTINQFSFELLTSFHMLQCLIFSEIQHLLHLNAEHIYSCFHWIIAHLQTAPLASPSRLRLIHLPCVDCCEINDYC